MTMQAPPQGQQSPKQFKSQPWMLFDTIAARSFLLGDTTNGLAIGSQNAAISGAGEITFMSGSGRTQANYPWYTNLDVSSQLSYGLEVWQIYVATMFPSMPNVANIGYDLAAAVSPPGTLKLAEAIINFGVLELQLGQENQASWPVHRFGAGGGVAQSSSSLSLPTNGVPEGANVLKLPEPIEMGRTQNLYAKIKLATEVHALIGTVAAPGVGQPLTAYSYGIAATPTVVTLAQPPFAVQLGLVGRRVKKTQYGQLPGMSAQS